jgi:flagellar biosynthesis/type III secretory pathway M-ring protein FliF/YscJ
MFSDELKKMLIQVISSWQVLAVTGVLVVYIFLVNYVAKLYHRRRPKPLPASKKEEAQALAPSGDEDLNEEESAGE